MTLVSRVLPGLILVTLAGCGGAAAPSTPQTPEPAAEAPAEAEAPSSASEKQGADFESLDQAESALQQAQAELDAFSAPAAATPSSGEAEADEARASRAAPAAAGGAGPSRCTTACQAFASLERAARAVCRIAGDSDARCARGKSAVDSYRSRVAACGC
jgi:hypothetical protein